MLFGEKLGKTFAKFGEKLKDAPRFGEKLKERIQKGLLNVGSKFESGAGKTSDIIGKVENGINYVTSAIPELKPYTNPVEATLGVVRKGLGFVSNLGRHSKALGNSQDLTTARSAYDQAKKELTKDYNEIKKSKLEKK